MSFSRIATGLQHIGVPTNDIEATVRFYTALGFEVAHRANKNAVKYFTILGPNDEKLEFNQYL